MVQQLTLSDGRRLDYLVEGAQDSFPLIYLHGTVGAYTPNPLFRAACERKGVRVITLSRAGYGDSTRNKGRSVVDAVKDIEELKRHLGIDKCFVAGWSGGGPHALACAARLPGCIATLCIASVAPWDAEGLDYLAGQGQDNIDETEAVLKGEDAFRALADPQRTEILQLDGPGLAEMMSSIFPPVDKAIISKHPELGTYLADLFHVGLKNGVDGWLDDDLAFVKPWGFEFDEIKVPVFVYHGEEDKMAPFGHGEWLANHLPKHMVRRRLQKGEGHVSIFVPNLDKMIDDLLGCLKG